MHGIGGHHVKYSKPDPERQRPHVFSFMWKIDAKSKHDHTQIYMSIMFIIMELLYGTQGGRKGKQNERESTILKYITYVQVEDVMIYTESYCVLEDRRRSVRRATEGT
jgi:hypothetical protein